MNFNTYPYYDDYNEDNKFLRILFRPGYPVQARELTQSQTILQNQISRVGNHLFKNGSKVTGGDVGYDQEYPYVKLQTYYSGIDVATYISDFVGQKIIGDNSGVVALVVYAEPANDTGDLSTLYIQYIKSGEDNVSNVFENNERIVTTITGNKADDLLLIAADPAKYADFYRYAYTYNDLSGASACGLGSSASIQDGVYYINGFFVKVDAQRIILEKYGTTPSGRVGLEITERTVAPEDDDGSSLYDNAIGSSNYTAPGAHRYKIELTLVLRGLEDADGDTKFVELMRIENGVLKSLMKNTQYADIMDTMARRTYDESGNYTVKPFGINVREHRNNDRGIWLPNTEYKSGDIVKNAETGKYYTARSSGISYGTNPPSHYPEDSTPANKPYLPVKNDNGTSGIWWEYTSSADSDGIEKRVYNNGVYKPEDGGDESLIAMGIERGKAYVYGYEIEKLDTTYLPIPKARTYANILDGTISTPVGNYIKVKSISGIPDLSTFPTVNLFTNLAIDDGNSSNGLIEVDHKIGTARIRGIELDSGVNGSVDAIYKLSLFDIDMHDGAVTGTVVVNGGTSGYTSLSTITFSEPYTATSWASQATVAVGSYVKATITYQSPDITGLYTVTNYWKVVNSTAVDPALPTLGTTAPSQTIRNEVESNGNCILEYVGTRATGRVYVESGKVIGVSIVNPGCGYLTTPTITISGGSDAAVTAILGKIDFSRCVKRVFSNTFTAQLSEETTDLAGTISWDGTGTGTTASPFKVTGNGTSFNNLKSGDHIITSDGKRVVVGYVVNSKLLYAYSINPATAFSAQAYSSTSCPIYDPKNTSLVFPVPYQYIRTIRDMDDSSISTVQYVRKQFAPTTVSTQTVSYTTDFVNETFMTPDFGSYGTDENYLLAVTFVGTSQATLGEIVLPTNMSLTPNSRSLTVTVASRYNGAKLTLITTVKQSQTSAHERIKTLERNYKLDKIYEYQITGSSISLEKPDIYRVVRISQCVGVDFGNAYDDTKPEIDLTDNYILDDGQRSTHYDIGSITLKPGRSAPTGPIRVIFEYFSHDTNGSYFSVDSYVGIDYKDIPKFKGKSLADVIDYRPAMNSDGLTFSSAPNLPKRTSDMSASYSYYYSRRGIVYLKKNGLLSNVEGVPSDTPELPSSVNDSMDLYKILYRPYTIDVTTNNVIPQFIENRRYTMRDIDDLNVKLTQIINYTNMSSLERSTSSTEIMDPVLGSNRLKAGFITDPFDSHQMGDINAVDYAASIDTVAKELRPLYNIENINLVEQNTSESQRTAKGYTNNNDVLTLRYENVELVKQTYASRTENINPFAIFTFIGEMKMNPDTDEWVDIENVDITNIDESEKEALTSLANKSLNPYTGKIGLLGNYYGSWEQVATGVTRTVAGPRYTISDFTRAHASVNTPNSGNYRDQHDEVTAMQMQSVRKVYTNEIKLVGSSPPVLTGDRVTSTSIVPYIRSRPILFVAKALKPETTVNAYFDNTYVNDYVTPATKLTYSVSSGTFDDSSPVGAGSKETARLSAVGGNTALAYNKGDIVYVSSRTNIGGVTTAYTLASSPATAIVALVESFETNGTKVVHLVNVKGSGSFESGDTIVGSISGASGIVKSIATPTSLVTNVSGQVAGVFTIPNNAQMSFRTGSRIFRISDTSTNAGSTTRAEKTYLASGVKETHQRTFSSIGHYEIATRELGREVGNLSWVNIPGTQRVVVDSKSNGYASGGWYDPLAQTFLVQNEGGAMLTRLDVYFQSKDTNLPVRLEIRETDNGYPSKVILPFSQVTLEADQVNVSDDATVATTFIFPTPVALRDKTEYAIVLLSDSNAYKVWISQVGEPDIKTGRLIGEQPYMGVLFKSQNGSTWTAEQMQDLKFVLYRAKYETGTVATVDLVNDVLPYQDLIPNPFETQEGSGIVTVTQYNHGLSINSYVQFEMDETMTVNGIPASDFMNNPLTSTGLQQVKTIIDQHTYTIEVARTGNIAGVTPVPYATGYAGGAGVRASRNIQFNELYPQIEEFLMPDTYVEYTVQAVSGRSVGGTETPYVFQDGFVDLVSNSSNFFEYPQMVASAINQEKFMQNASSLTIRAKMYTTNDACTPMLNLSRTSALVVENIINNDTPTEETDQAVCRYLTKKIKLATAATGIYAEFNANISTMANVTVQYKVGNSSDTALFEVIPWKELPIDGTMVKTDDRYVYNTYAFKLDTVPNFEGGFNMLQVKLVMTSENSSAVPKIRDLKVVALV